MIAGIAAILTRHLGEVVKLRACASAFYAGAAAILLFALAFGLIALRNWLAVAQGVRYPDLWIALALFVVAAPLIGVGYSLQKRKPPTHPMADIALIAGPPAIRIAARGINARVVAIGAVLIAGVIVGRKLTR